MQRPERPIPVRPPVFQKEERNMAATLGFGTPKVNSLEYLQTTFLVFVFAKNYH